MVTFHSSGLQRRLICWYCGEPFYPHRLHAKTCGVICRMRWFRLVRRVQRINGSEKATSRK